MTITSSTQSLALAIADLSQKLSELASLMNPDAAETAANATAVGEAQALKTRQMQKKKTSNEAPKAVPTAVDRTPTVSADPSGSESFAESDPVVIIEQVRAGLAEKSQAGLTGQVKTLLEQFGAAKLSGVNPADYAKLITAARALN